MRASHETGIRRYQRQDVTNRAFDPHRPRNGAERPALSRRGRSGRIRREAGGNHGQMCRPTGPDLSDSALRAAEFFGIAPQGVLLILALALL